MLRAMASYTDAAAAEGRIFLLNEPTLLNCRCSRLNLLGFGVATGYKEADEANSDMKRVSYPSGVAFVSRRNAFLQVGGFDGTYFPYCEDVNPGLRFHAAGWTAINVPSARSYHDYRKAITPYKLRYL